jgi:hypothetical protein
VESVTPIKRAAEGRGKRGRDGAGCKRGEEREGDGGEREGRKEEKRCNPGEGGAGGGAEGRETKEPEKKKAPQERP